MKTLHVRNPGLRSIVAVAVGAMLGVAVGASATTESAQRNVQTETACEDKCAVRVTLTAGLIPDYEVSCDTGGDWKCYKEDASDGNPDGHSKGATEPPQI